MKKLKLLVVLFSVSLLFSCTSSEIEDEVTSENNLELKSSDKPTIPSFPPPPVPCPKKTSASCR